MSEIFREGKEKHLEELQYLRTGNMHHGFFLDGLEILINGFIPNAMVLIIALVFIDGMVLGISRPTVYAEQMVAYNGNKRNIVLKY